MSCSREEHGRSPGLFPGSYTAVCGHEPIRQTLSAEFLHSGIRERDEHLRSRLPHMA